MNREKVEKLRMAHEDITSAIQDLNDIDFPPSSWKQGKRRLIQVALASARLRIEGILEDGECSTF